MLAAEQSEKTMAPGDFTALAQAYVHRPAYAEPVIDAILARVKTQAPAPMIADIGAGTGKLTAMLDARGLKGTAIEPNAAMRHEGEALRLGGFHWREGQAEATGLKAGSVDWVTMASAFHWADAPRALQEFHRILKPGGFVTLLWNPRDLVRDRLQARIEGRIALLAPGVRRRSSGAAAYTEELEDTLLRDGLFTDLVFCEGPHAEPMTRERHLGAWASVNDIPAQVGPALWAEILQAIEEELGDLQTIDVLYRTRAWTVRKSP